MNTNIVNPVDANRKAAPNQNSGQSISWQSSFKSLAEEIASISLNTGLG